MHSFLTREIPFQYKKLICKSCNSLSHHCLNEEISGYTNKCSVRKMLVSFMYFWYWRWISFHPEMVTLLSDKKKTIKKYYFNKPSVLNWIKLLSTQKNCAISVSLLGISLSSENFFSTHLLILICLSELSGTSMSFIHRYLLTNIILYLHFTK